MQLAHQYMYVNLCHVTGSCKGPIGANQEGVGGGVGENFISHDASLRTILSSVTYYVILIVTWLVKNRVSV